VIRIVARVVITALVALPVTLVVTFVLMPLWSWIESRFHIESVGHSGPSNWCFFVVYGTLVVTGLALQYRRMRSGGPLYKSSS
jgi:uncharacterized membrane protein